MICSRLCRLFTQLPTALVFGSILLAGPFSRYAQCTGGASLAISPYAERDSPIEQAQTAPQTQPAQPPPQQAPPQQPPPQQPANPFETVPQQTEPAKPAQQQGVQEAKVAAVNENTIEGVEFRGQRRVPQDTLRALIYTKKGDTYDPESLHRDYMALWNTGRFDDLTLETEKGPAGGIIIRFVVVERRIIRSIDYSNGLKSISKSEVLDRFKERKVSLTPESNFDMGKVQYARNVLLEYLSERGRQYATVTPDIRQVPPSSVEIVFQVDEGPKVQVGHIQIQGNKAFSNHAVVQAMKNLKPIGIPHSWLFEDLFARTFDSTKIEEDSERIRQFYQKNGYFRAHVVSHTETIRDTTPEGWRVPFFKTNKPGKVADITMVVDEGEKYSLRNFNFVGMKLFRTPDLIAKSIFGMSSGDVFSTEKLQKGLDNMRKLYGNFGYIDFVPEPDPEPVPGTNKIDLTINVDEGKQFFVRRIDFSGNHSTRDKVIRRELLIDEGDLFSQQLWDTSILRLNQLGFFEPLKPEDAATLTRDTKTNTVDLTLKVKERGKNSIQMNGGVSGLAGSFIGFSYSTNNFLGLGETLSLNSQIGTRLKSVTLGFTEPYIFDKPIQTGFTIFYQHYNFNQAQQASILAGTNLIPYYNSLGPNNLLNYSTNSRGFTTFVSYQLRHSFARVGLTYGFDIQNVNPTTPAALNYFTYLDFEGIAGPNSLAGIKSSKITPTFTYNTVNHPLLPTAGKRITFAVQVAGIGGNVDTIQPSVDMAYFRRGLFKKNVQGFHFTGKFLMGYDGRVAPPYSRFYMGGENDIRGFDIWSISPAAYIPTTTSIGIYNSDGSPRTQRVVTNGTVTYINVTETIPIYQPIFPGGDTEGVFNYEYRIPLVGPVSLTPFFDVGIDKLLLPGQLRLNADQIGTLNGLFPQADFNTKAIIVPQTQMPRMSTGLELDVLMPVVNAPFRLYWAYNPLHVETNLVPPNAADLTFFPNAATYANYRATYPAVIPYAEKPSLFRFSVGRTF
jgi:outer membrane protein insertion porin family